MALLAATMRPPPGTRLNWALIVAVARSGFETISTGLRRRYHQPMMPGWTGEEVALLGTMPDEQLARRTAESGVMPFSSCQRVAAASWPSRLPLGPSKLEDDPWSISNLTHWATLENTLRSVGTNVASLWDYSRA